MLTEVSQSLAQETLGEYTPQAIDWLMAAPGGRDSLNVLNFDGLTPLTLAARSGSVEIFNHILHTHMSTVAWVYGKVRGVQAGASLM